MIKSRFASAGISLFCVGISFKKDFHRSSIRFFLVRKLPEYIFMFDRSRAVCRIYLYYIIGSFSFLFFRISSASGV